MQFSLDFAKNYIKQHKLKVDLNEFHMGLNVELEHGAKSLKTNVTNDNPHMTAQIALAHLNEFPDYYTRLKKMEEGAKAALKSYERND